MTKPTLSEAAARFVATLKDTARPSALAELNRFVRWYGPDRPLEQLRGHDVSLYAEVLGPATAEASRRADQVRTFLAYLKKEGLLAVNLAPHLRLRKGNRPDAPRVMDAVLEVSREGLAALEVEVASLKAQRPKVQDEIRRAMLDKDFRENAPLDAAKEKQGHLEARIREIEHMLKNVVIVEGGQQGTRVHVGSTVVVKNLGSQALTRYTIVGPTEASAADGKISSASPVGQALLQRSVGDEVSVSVPAGTLRFRVEEIVE
ncbi:MAG TPA: transcription elongation factor GreA [Dehalococcoidia bacterium]|nr:transcription elongation factor GreA [Dehalococcoidia bacterium]